MPEDPPGSLTRWTVDAFGTRVSVANLSSAEMDDLDRHWRRCRPRRDSAAEAASTPVFTRRGEIPWSWQEGDIVSQVTLSGIAGAAGKLMMFHAGGVSDPGSGRSIALVAASGTGKTTAVHALARSLGYLSDETVAVDPDSLTIRPYPKPLSLLGPDGRRPKSQHSPDDLGLLPAPVNPRLHRIAMLRRHPDASGVRIERLPLLEALQELAPQSSSLFRLERGVVALARILDRTGGLLRIEYRESSELIGPVTNLLHNIEDSISLGSGISEDGWQPVDFQVDAVQIDAVEMAGSGRLLRARADDALLVGDLLAVLAGERLHFLSGLGITVWDACSSWRSPEELHALTLEKHGPHPRSATLTAEATHCLLEAGLLVT